MNPFYMLIAQYGLEGTMAIIEAVEKTGNPSLEDLSALKAKYGTKTGAQYLAEALAAQNAALSNTVILTGQATPINQ